MKKNIVLIIPIFLSFILLLITPFSYPKVKPQTENQYLTSSNYFKDNSLINFDITNNAISYLVKENNHINLYTSTFTTPPKYKSQVDEDTCTIDRSYILCNKESNLTIYNLNLEKLFSQENIISLDFNIIPYKDTFLKLINKKLYLPEQDDLLFQELDLNGTYKDFFQTKDTTYLLFTDYEKDLSYIYDINTKTKKEIPYTLYFNFNKGFYFYNASNFYFLNLLSNEEQTIPNPFNSPFYYSVYYYNSNLYLYYNNTLYNYNINNATITELISNISSPNNLLATDDYLIYSLQDTIYTLNLSKNPNKPLSLKEYYQEKEHTIKNYQTAFLNKYNIALYTKDAIDPTLFPDFTAENLYDNETIINALTVFDTLLNKFPNHFFDIFKDTPKTKLNLYLTGTLTPKDYTTQVASPAAYSLVKNGDYMIVIDITKQNLSDLLSHELMHNLEFKIAKDAFLEYQHYNPEDFNYTLSYTKTPDSNYTLKEKDNNTVYFIDTYSKTYPEEDRARLFETIMNPNINLKNYPHLYQKALYLKEKLIEYYPSLINFEPFTTLN